MLSIYFTSCCKELFCLAVLNIHDNSTTNWMNFELQKETIDTHISVIIPHDIALKNIAVQKKT